MIRELALALAVVAPCSVEVVAADICDVDRTVDPHVAALTWSDGSREDVATINWRNCQCFVEKALPQTYRGLHITEVRCEHRDGFARGWDVIRGFNDR